MYNHYTPQSDGSYRRSSMPDSRPAAPQMNIPASAPAPEPPHPPVCGAAPSPCPPPPGLFAFLRNLLPGTLDSADLTVIFLVLLLNRADCDDGTSPLLTLALYFLL